MPANTARDPSRCLCTFVCLICVPSSSVRRCERAHSATRPAHVACAYALMLPTAHPLKCDSRFARCVSGGCHLLDQRNSSGDRRHGHPRDDLCGARATSRRSSSQRAATRACSRSRKRRRARRRRLAAAAAAVAAQRWRRRSGCHSWRPLGVTGRAAPLVARAALVLAPLLQSRPGACCVGVGHGLSRVDPCTHGLSFEL
jgi:hypothetical protein